jgi:GntR family transcriptional repressor for pyruvate dehydrogenase complex
MTRPQGEQVILFGVTQVDSGDAVTGTTATSAPRSPAGAADASGGRGAYRPGYELIAEQILELIARSQLLPGDRMPTENEIAGQLGTSRTVVREAIKILSALGRIKAHKGRGLYVADDDGMLGMRWGGFFLPTDLDHIYMLFEFRRVQEAEASRLAATRATPTELRAIEAAEQLCREGHVTEQPELFSRGDDDFHHSIAAASHNPFLVAAVREARRLLMQSAVIGLRGTLGGHAAEAVEEHAAIYQAIRDGEPAEAAHFATVHLDKTLEDYRREIQRRVFGA